MDAKWALMNVFGGPEVRAMTLFSNNAYHLGIYFTFIRELVSPSQQ